jgi:uncharacterized protein (TIGR02147 family)
LVKKEKKLHLAVKSLHTLQDVPSAAIRRYHDSMIENAKEALHVFPVEVREFQGKTIAIPNDQIQEAKQLIRNFSKHFDRKIDVTRSDSVYQLNIQFFPLTDAIEKKEAP